MVLFSTYRSTRFVSREFMQGPVLRLRGCIEYYISRVWNGSLEWGLPGEVRFYAAGIPFIYFVGRWQNDHSLEIDGYYKALIMRWGGTLEEARKLSPQDQLRVRTLVETEKLYSAYGPKDLIVQPAGDTLPGKDLYHPHGQHAH